MVADTASTLAWIFVLCWLTSFRKHKKCRERDREGENKRNRKREGRRGIQGQEVGCLSSLYNYLSFWGKIWEQEEGRKSLYLLYYHRAIMSKNVSLYYIPEDVVCNKTEKCDYSCVAFKTQTSKFPICIIKKSWS